EHMPKNDDMADVSVRLPDPAQGEQQLINNKTASVKEEQPSVQETTSAPPITKQAPLKLITLVVHASVEKDLEEKVSKEEPPSKRLNLFKTTSSEYSSTPSKDESKGKGIATKENPMKGLIPLVEEGGSALQLLNLNQFSIFGKKMTLEDAQAQLAKMKRLADLKAEQEKTKKKLKKLSPAKIQAQAQKLVKYEAKRKRMLEEYNHYISYRADELPILKINYKIEKVTKDATMRIERNNQPLTLIVNSKSNDILLKNLKAKFEWIKTQARKLGIHPPSELLAFGLSAAEKKRKRSSKIIQEVFVKYNIIVDGMQRNLIPPPGVEGTRGLVIKEPELGIFFYNGNFDLVFKREEE
ncbi:hypothetical protein Tco_0029709, partial [Tanacetum coccineum]